ncbi:MAG: hypothetical protein CHACPFDD_01017 [Phycisphaerae bacterium]|nr:hypothetical protein [Phycisphaerae bacterium]
MRRSGYAASIERRGRARLAWALLAAGLATAPWAAEAAITHTQRLHDPAGAGGAGVEIEPWAGGYIYLANQINPYLLPAGFNRRPVLVRTDAALNPVAAYTYMRPFENTTMYSTQLYLTSTDFYKTRDGGFIICGDYAEGDELFGGGLTYGAFLLKIDGSTLQPNWFRQYPATNPQAYVQDIHFLSVVETIQPNGQPMYAVAGNITTSNLNEALVAGFDNLGNVMWLNELTGFEGGWGSANEVIVYDADSIAVTGQAHGAPHIHCQNFEAHGDVLVARLSNDGTPQFVALYGRSFEMINGVNYSVMEQGASLTRPTNSPDLIIVGKTQAWSTIDDCAGAPAFDEMLAFRVDPSGTVVWAHRYGLAGASSVAGVQVKSITAFVAIAADTWTTLNNVHSENVGYFRLMSGGGSLAQQTEIFGGAQSDFATGIIPLGPPYPQPAVIVGTSNSFGSFYQKPYLIHRQVFAQKPCHDAVISTSITPVPLPLHEVIMTQPLIPILSQELTLLDEPVADRNLCRKAVVDTSTTTGVISPGSVGVPPPPPAPRPDGDSADEPGAEPVVSAAAPEGAGKDCNCPDGP